MASSTDTKLRKDIDRALETILKETRAELTNFVVENKEHLSELPRDVFDELVEHLRGGNTLEAEITLYASLDYEQRKRYRQEALDSLKNAEDRKLRAVAVLSNALDILSNLATFTLSIAGEALWAIIFREMGITDTT